MKKYSTTHFITLQKESASSPDPISQETWDKLLSALKDILHPHNTPLELCGQKNQGSILIDSNVVSFSPVDPEQGGDFTLKRVGSKILTRIKSKSSDYDVVIGACLLAVRKFIPQASVSQTKGASGWESPIRYYQYATQMPAPIVHPSQARSVTVDFQWNASTPAEDCAEVLQDIRTLLEGVAVDITIEFDKPE